MSTYSDIRPCPFCGSTPDADLVYGAAMISCLNDDCGISMVMLDEPFLDEIVDRWNKRAKEST